MNRTLLKSVLRTIRGSIGRYLAILMIIALGCGFFSGLRICRDAMVKTGDKYLTSQNFYDLRLITEIGLTPDDKDAFASLAGIRDAEGLYSADAMFSYCLPTETVKVFHVMSLPGEISLPALTAGRMPENASECLADQNVFLEEDIGKTLTLAKGNSEETASSFSKTEYTIVGLVSSPMYLNYERGTSPIGTGSVTGFLYVLPEVFTSGYYTELCLTLDASAPLFSEKYNASVDAVKSTVEVLLADRTKDRFDRIYPEAEAEAYEALNQAKEKLDAARAKLDAVDYDALTARIDSLKRLNQLTPSEFLEELIKTLEAQSAVYLDGLAAWETANAAYGTAKEQADAELSALRARLEKIGTPATFVLTRNENIGYACFDNDSGIVQGISMVFPVFFFLLAALICSTTMTRMVTDDRTQNGVLKALGFSASAIMTRYTVYAGSAAVIGSVSGYFIGTIFIPKLIWAVYRIMYHFAPIEFVFSPVLFLISISVSLLCSVGSAWLSCRTSLRETPAGLIRPKAPKNAKRIFLERVTPLWSRMKFLHKVSARNIFRYRKRFIMMILGIAGCTALLVTGFGIRDSVSGIADDQFGKISVYDLSVTFTGNLNDEELDEFSSHLPECVDGVFPLTSVTWDAVGTSGTKNVNMIISDGQGIGDFWHFASDGDPVSYPGDGGAILDRKLAEVLGVRIGDSLVIRDTERNELTVNVTGIFDNYVYNYVCITPGTCRGAWGETPAVNSVLLNVSGNDDPHAVSATILQSDKVAAVALNSDMQKRVNNVMSRLNYIVLLVLVCAGALALIVLYNLTNINITERSREIATLKVLGFHRQETASYVFRENLVLTFLGALAGLPLGLLLHRFVMSQINVDLVSFSNYISPLSYLISLAITFAFALLVGFFLQFRIVKINMADSLKSVE